MTAIQTAHNAREIGQRIMALMNVLGDSQAEFCRRTGISDQSLSNYFHGLRRISLDQALQICDSTGATLDWIYFGDPSGLPLKFAALAVHEPRRA